MEINQFKLDNTEGVTLHLSEREAVVLINSLTSQIMNGSSNVGRNETQNCTLNISKNKKLTKKERIYFSAFVTPE